MSSARCKVSIASEIVENNVIIHRQLLDLAPSSNVYITCEATTGNQVPNLHGKIASETSQGSLLLDGQIFSYENLTNKTFVDQNLRLLETNEYLLKVFHTYGRFNIQCLKDVEFELNGQQINCKLLQKFKLKNNFTLRYQDELLKAQVLINHSKKLSNTWMSDYTFGNIPLSYMPTEVPQENFLPPVIHEIVFTEAGNVNVQSISLFTSGTVIFILLLCGCCCYKFENFRNFWKKWITALLQRIYKCFTSETFRTKRENAKMRREIEIKKEAIRKNLEDINLFNRAMGDSPANHMEDSSSAISLDHNRKGVTWHKNTETQRESSSTSVNSNKSIV